MTLYVEDRDSAVLAPVKAKSCFLAHAYEKEVWGNLLVQDLHPQGVTCISPFRDMKPREFLRIAFNGAKDTALFIADLSIPNPNVLFELGMAIGLNRPPLLIVQEAKTSTGVPNILKDVKHHVIKDRGHLVSIILETLNNQERIAPTTNSINPFELGPWNLDMSWHLCYFPARERGDDNRALDRTLGRLKRGLQITRADEVSQKHSNLHQLLSVAATSATNVLRFLPPDDKDASSCNLDTAFIAGFSYGTGKQTICVIPKDLEGLLSDIRESSIVFNNETELETALEKCVMEIKSEIQIARTKSRAYSLQQKVELKAREIRLVRFGDVEASRDDLLLQAYEEWNHTDEVLAGTRPIVLGRKGTGKTALKRYIEERLLRPDRTFCLSIDPIDSDLEELYSMKPKSPFQRLDIPRLGGQAKRLWLHLLPIYLASSITQEVITRLSPEQSKKAGIILDLVNTMVQQASISYYAAARFSSYINGEDTNARGIALDEDLVDLAKYASGFLDDLAEHGLVGYVLIDSLDKMWHTKSIIPMAFTFGLIDAVRDINIKHGYIPILLLRQDIYRVLQQFIPETDKLQPLFLDWSRTSLWNCIAKRIRTQLPNKCYDLKECVDTIFENVNGRSSLDDILDLVSLKPREAIKLCTYCWDKAIDENRTKITKADVDIKAKTLSEDRLFWLHDEYQRGMPWMADFAYGVVGKKGVFSLKEWCSFIDSILQDHKVLSDSGDSLIDRESRRDQVTSDLIRIGVVKYITPETELSEATDFLIDPDFTQDVEHLLPSALLAPKRSLLSHIFQAHKEEAVGSYILRAQYRLGIS